MHEQDAPAATRYRAGVLGPFTLEHDGASVDTSRWQRKVEVLFKLLLTAPGRQRRRDDLIDVLWPDAESENGDGNLRMLVHRLRATIDLRDPSPVLSDGGWVALNPECEWELDLEELESVAADPAAALDVLEHAATLYRSEPLPEDRYEDWAQPLRERATRAWRALCLRLARLQMSRAAHDDGICWLERALEADPFDEEAIRNLLAALCVAGRPAEALRRYAAFERLFEEEIDAPPSPETRALVESIRGGQDGSIDASALVPAPETSVAEHLGPVAGLPLFGREQEMEIALAAVHAAAAGAGRLVLLSGEQGIGKTRLAQEIARHLAESGFSIAVARCTRRRRPILWAPFLEALETLVRTTPAAVRVHMAAEWPFLTTLLSGGPDLALAPGNEVGQRQLFSAVGRFLRALASEQPVAILLDDLHWADEATLDLLHHLARELRSSRVFLLGTYSDEDISRQHPVALALREMAQEGLSERIALPRLGPDETAALVRIALGDAPGTEAFAEYVYRRTRGVPFFVHRLLHVLGGRYRLLRPVGAGGMGWVFEAEDTSTGGRVAVKIVFARREADPRMLLRFQQEASALSRLDHPGIVRIHEAEADEYGGRIVMDLLPGRSLAVAVPPEGLSLASVKSIALQTAAALACAHEHGILHRDIKPDNIVLDDAGHATLTDFGIARVLWPAGAATTLTATAAAFGTSIYMSPEQVERSREDARSDVYSLGVMLYELATGHPPFEGDDPMSVAVKHVHLIPAPPSVLRPGLPGDWDAVICRCLAKAPSERFQSAAALERAIGPLSTPDLPPLGAASPQPSGLSALAAAARGNFAEPATSRIAESGPTPRPRLGRRWMAAVVAAASITLLAAGAFFLFERRAGSNPEVVQTPSAQSASSQGIGPGQFFGPSGIGTDLRGNVWVADVGNNRVQELSSTGVPIAQFGSRGNRNGQFNTPEDLAVTSHGAIWIDDKNNFRVEKVDLSGHELNELLPPGTLAVDPSDHLYVADLPHQRVWEYTWNGDELGTWSVPDVRVQHRPYPAGIAVDGRGHVYVADRANSRVLVLVPRGPNLAPIQILGTDPHQYVFNHPSDVALDRAGNIYVADTRNNRIVKLSPQGKLIAVWGSPGTGLGQFNEPSSLAVDAQGAVYVTDYFHDRVQKFSPAGKPLWATAGRRPIRR